MKTAFITVLAAGLGAAGTWLLRPTGGNWSANPTIEQVERLASLVVLRVPVADIETCELHGHLGSVRAVLVVRGDVEIATDLRSARFVSIDTEHKRAMLVLPAPQARRPRLDHEQTELWTIDWSGVWTVLPGRGKEKDLVNEAMERAQHVVEQAGRQPIFLTMAREQAEQILGGFYEILGWQVQVRWQDRAAPAPPSTSPAGGRQMDQGKYGWLPGGYLRDFSDLTVFSASAISCDRRIPRAAAIRTMFSRLTFRSPCSMSPMYVRCRPTLSANDPLLTCCWIPPAATRTTTATATIAWFRCRRSTCPTC